MNRTNNEIHTTYLTIQTPLHRRHRRPKPRYPRPHQPPRHLTQPRLILHLILKLRKMEPSPPIGLQLQKPRRDDVVVEVDNVTADVAGAAEDEASFLRCDELGAFDDGAGSYDAAVHEGGEEDHCGVVVGGLGGGALCFVLVLWLSGCGVGVLTSEDCCSFDIEN